MWYNYSMIIYKNRLAFYFLSLFLFLGISSCSGGAEWENGIKYKRVSLTDLVSSPSKFENKGIIYSGYLRQYNASFVIYDTKEAWYIVEPFREIVLITENDLSKCHGSYVYAKGKFSIDDFGAMNIMVDGIEYTTKVPSIFPDSSPTSDIDVDGFGDCKN